MCDITEEIKKARRSQKELELELIQSGKYNSVKAYETLNDSCTFPYVIVCKGVYDTNHYSYFTNLEDMFYYFDMLTKK